MQIRRSHGYLLTRNLRTLAFETETHSKGSEKKNIVWSYFCIRVLSRALVEVPRSLQERHLLCQFRTKPVIKLRVDTKSSPCPQERLRNVESQPPPKTHRVRICVFIRSPGAPCTSPPPPSLQSICLNSEKQKVALLLASWGLCRATSVL